MANPIHHQSIRKRSRGKKPSRGVVIFDRLIIVVGLLNAVATLPQVLQIWLSQNASGVSVLSWSYYAFGSALFLAYGIIHKEPPIVINYAAGMTLYILIVVGTLLYS